MWPFSSYPERRAQDVDGKTYDYIIVGGGCAGCVLASRLSESPTTSVLVLERGRVRDSFFSRIPLLSQGHHLSWMQGVRRLSEPIHQLGGRRMIMWTSESLGGASRVNGMLLTRGVPGGYDGWAREFGLDDWGWDRVEPFFRRSENALGHPDAKHRGHDGPVVNYQPASTLAHVPFLEKAASAIGLPVSRDANDPKGSAQGFFYFDKTIDAKSRRVSSFRAWLNADIANERKDRLSVCTGVVASRLEIDPNGKGVTGVHILDARRSGDDREYFVKARREVIICSGTVCTPQLLMLSGIGPKEQIEANGIPLVRELPAVGVNLTDHYAVPLMHELRRKDTVHQIETAWGFIWHLLLYLFFGKGLLAAGTTPATIFARSSAIDGDTMTVRNTTDDGRSTMDGSDPQNVPDIEVILIPVRSILEMETNLPLSSMHVALTQPFSRGRIELASTDPREHPRIYYNVLSDSRDVAVCRKAVRFAMHLAEQFAKSGYPYPAPLTFAPGMDLTYLDSLFAKTNAATVTRTREGAVPDLNSSTPEEPAPLAVAALKIQQSKDSPRSWRSTTDAEIDAYVRRMCVSALHFSSSCRMSLSAEDGVVDQRLRVHGIRGLRIADASVFPRIPSAHTMAPTIMVAERCADFLKEEWEEGRRKAAPTDTDTDFISPRGISL